MSRVYLNLAEFIFFVFDLNERFQSALGINEMYYLFIFLRFILSIELVAKHYIISDR